MSRLKVILITARTISQGITREALKATPDYAEAAAICELDPADMEKLNVKEGDRVRVTTPYGSVVLKAVESKQAPHPGIVMVPIGPWASELVRPDTNSVGMPSYKSIEAEVERA